MALSGETSLWKIVPRIYLNMKKFGFKEWDYTRLKSTDSNANIRQ